MKSMIIGIVVVMGIFAMVVAGQTGGNTVLKNPAALKAKAPETFKADFELGNAKHFVIEVHRAWAPNGADRFYNMVKNGFFDGTRFFRVVPGFMVQFGIHGDPAVSAPWRDARIPDDPVKESNKRGYVTFATAGPGTRTTQIFINFKDNTFLDSQGFSPFGQVITGMETVDGIYSGDGERPDQTQVQTQGNAYLTKSFPKLDYVKKATITP
jgi:peptidyl-prolyl cis-trans isomerase A (cyclophilin A)